MDRALYESFRAVTKEEEALLSGSALKRELYTASDAFIIDAQKLMDKGRLISFRPHTRFIAFPAHQHNYIELMYMLCGETVHTVNGGETIRLKKGELLLMNQHASHAIEAAGPDDVAVNLIILPAFFDAVLDMLGIDNILSRFLIDALRSTDTTVSCLHFEVAGVLEIQSLMESLLAFLSGGGADQRRISQTTVGLLFLHLINHTDKTRFGRSEPRQNALVLAALREIEANYKSANLSLVAERFHVSLSYLSRAVKEATGLNYKQLLQEKRLKQAAALLKNTELTIAEVMAAVGYNNSSYFYNLFLSKYGLTPALYRLGSDRSSF